MFRLPNAPSPRADIHELADFVEWQAWKDGSISLRAANSAVNRLDDNFHNNGCRDDSDATADFMDDVFLELERRNAACNGGYPFQFERNGTVFLHLPENLSDSAITYRFLLMATRLNMATQNVHAELNGTFLMEELGASVMRNYLGSARAESYLFGTSESVSFSDHVNSLCQAMGEGGSFSPADPGRLRAKDAKVDVVSWVPFADRNPGKLVVFTQCKTGTTWRSHLGDLQPEAFMKTWTRNRCLNLTPMRAFCIAEALDRSRWVETASQAGLFLDRCRIVDFAAPLEADLVDRMNCWTDIAFQSVLSK